MSNLIRREDAIEAVQDHFNDDGFKGYDDGQKMMDRIKSLPSAEPQPKSIFYIECANAMLKMWIDNVLTDGEYYRIMEKLNSKHMADMKGGDSE